MGILLQSEFTLFDIKLLDADDFMKLMIRFVLHFTVISLISFIYYKHAKKKTYVFTLMLISSVVFLLCFLLENVKIELGFAVGLFAVFGILRYRTNQIPIKEMTYMFIAIGIGVINALSNKKVSYSELLFTNALILIITFFLERVLYKNEISQTIEYEKIDLIKPEKRAELKKDLEKRTGLKILRVEIGRINFLRDTCRIKIYYNIEDNQEPISKKE